VTIAVQDLTRRSSGVLLHMLRTYEIEEHYLLLKQEARRHIKSQQWYWMLCSYGLALILIMRGVTTEAHASVRS
jgi:hypothetical protein